MATGMKVSVREILFSLSVFTFVYVVEVVVLGPSSFTIYGPWCSISTVTQSKIQCFPNICLVPFSLLSLVLGNKQKCSFSAQLVSCGQNMLGTLDQNLDAKSLLLLNSILIFQIALFVYLAIFINICPNIS